MTTNRIADKISAKTGNAEACIDQVSASSEWEAHQSSMFRLNSSTPH